MCNIKTENQNGIIDGQSRNQWTLEKCLQGTSRTCVWPHTSLMLEPGWICNPLRCAILILKKGMIPWHQTSEAHHMPSMPFFNPLLLKHPVNLTKMVQGWSIYLLNCNAVFIGQLQSASTEFNGLNVFIHGQENLWILLSFSSILLQQFTPRCAQPQVL